MIHAALLIQFTVPLSEVEPHIPAHRAYLKEGYEAGRLLYSGPLVPRTGGLVLARAENRAELESLCARDPYALAGVATHTILEFDPVLSQPVLSSWLHSLDASR